MVQTVEKGLEYLANLPQELRFQGDATKGEIQLTGLSDDTGTGEGVVYEDKYVLLLNDPVEFPDGRKGRYLRVVEQAQAKHGVSGTVMIPIVDQHVIFLYQFRHPTRSWEWELPRGCQEPGLTMEDNAMKEVEEEIGVRPDQVELLGPIKPNTGLLSNTTFAFIAHMPADTLSRVKPAKEEAIFTIKAVAFRDVPSFVTKNVACGYSLASLMLAIAASKLS